MNVTLLVADAVWSNIESTGSVTEEQLSILQLLFGKNLEKATRIIDKRGVKKISGLPSGRSIFQVVGESQKREEYLCFPGDYCGCYSFFYDVVSRGEHQCVRFLIRMLPFLFRDFVSMLLSCYILLFSFG
ncbi:hypothetical protein ISN45_At04g036020 [Arabidopsis thaliana x Arabidopsis arenosa]|uniref:Uncharacterized protein n=1 Tax=Arabidopsis thaliana x Arabidopsis arenosa TaxID=1240361 RepID=A0A8T2E2F9_9BRAS|nr:hypothetical protein ISN45_At04g036020 [Arabidopsis thaliana x Arabidopsis arenosa]